MRHAEIEAAFQPRINYEANKGEEMPTGKKEKGENKKDEEREIE